MRKARRTVAKVGSKAKTPLVAGGAALAGLAGGVALKTRANSKGRLQRLPRMLKRIDADSITSAARRVRSFGEQVGDVADAADRTRKKHK